MKSDLSPFSVSHLFLSSVEDLEQQRKHDSDSGVGSDNRDNRLSATEVLNGEWGVLVLTHDRIFIFFYVKLLNYYCYFYSHRMKTVPAHQ